MIELKDFRCVQCGKLLGKIKGEAEIKCPRCNTINTVHTEQNKIKQSVT